MAQAPLLFTTPHRYLRMWVMSWSTVCCHTVRYIYDALIYYPADPFNYSPSLIVTVCVGKLPQANDAFRAEVFS